MDERWWDPKFHPLVAMNPVRIRYILDVVQQQKQATKTTPPLKDLKALDIGCGGGLLSESLARLGAKVTAIDPTETLVEKAKQHALQTGDPRIRSIHYVGGTSVEELAATASTDQQKYDVVCLLEVLEHATNVPSLVEAASSLVKPEGGLLFVSTMNRTWKSHLLTIIGAEYVMGYVPVGTHDWNQYLSPQEVNGFMENAGMECVNVSGMVLSRPPLCGNWDWRIDPNDTDVNWIGAYRRMK
jgi:2-polyprenyl-6-hydroxyphenyl methylase/3-demethylubiquinone-9 3-methyltransferase